MSTQKNPYFYKTEASTYHWELSCKSNYYKTSNKSWNIADTPPKAKIPCKYCTDKLDKTKQFWDKQI
jgi:hypothetical protein